jgi:hypothetical protein
MSILLDLNTKQVNYVAAFIQSDIDTEVFVEMPRGFCPRWQSRPPQEVSLWLKTTSKKPFQELSSKLEALSFVASDADPCLFVSEKVICLVYVDDTLFYASDIADIDSTIEAFVRLA